ncbi:hypothetical protein EMPS_07559 [Entomortierella parvispora]|uniref:Replication origin-binding protein domain-containing protein n=1 Tax=Entomortierella parvispora TaxID=205924 RepID=A0A9P3HEC6_9FUNG|nr:hypothetical protein EMPS_07559 [Entomortierella parvispora]
MNNKFDSTFFKFSKDQKKGPQDRCYEWSDQKSHSFFVVVNDGAVYGNEYSSYRDETAFLTAYDSIPEAKRCFYELIREGQACKEYYDIDWELDEPADEAELQRREKQLFAAFLCPQPEHAHSGSHKAKDPSRPLKRAQWHEPSVAAEDHEFLITNVDPDCAKVPSCKVTSIVQAPRSLFTASSKAKQDAAVVSSLPKHIVDAVRAKFEQTPHAAQFEMQCIPDRAMIFKLQRKTPGDCVVCDRKHEHENAYLKLTRSGAIFFHCHRAEGLKGLELFKQDISLASGIETSSAVPRGLSCADIKDDARYLTYRLLSPLPGDSQQPPSLLIRCDTGGGKTNFTEALVKANAKAIVKANPKPRFVAISCRRTLAEMLEARLDFENYQNIPGQIDCRRLVVQAESLFRLNLKAYVDEGTILILDELSSLIKQMCSDKTMGNVHNLNLQVFELLIRRAKRVICLDADLCEEEVEIMKSLRSDFVVIDNTFQQQKDDKVVLFTDKLKLIKEALELLKAGKRLWISSTMSAENTEAVHAEFEKAEFKGVCVTKNTPESVKKDVGRSINTIMKGLDYFIHTPTVSVGVNYDSEDGVDYVIGLFSSQTVDVETSMQMMRRTRHVKSKTYLVYADAKTNNLPVLPEEIKSWLCKQVDIVTGVSQLSPTLKFTFDDNTKLKLPDDLFHRMYCHVTSLKHLSMNNFRKKKAEITAARNQQIASAASISADEFEQLSSGFQDLDAAQRASVHKFALMRTYGVQEHSTVTEEWVATYDKPHEKECFKNLQALSVPPGKTLHDCLALPQQCEAMAFQYSLGNVTSAEAHNRLEQSRFVKLEFVVDILTAFGFTDTFAANEVLATDLKKGLDVIWPDLESGMKQICTTLKRERPTHNNWSFRNKLSYINTILHAVLGTKISAVNKRSEKYILKHHSKVGSKNNSPRAAFSTVTTGF